MNTTYHLRLYRTVSGLTASHTIGQDTSYMRHVIRAIAATLPEPGPTLLTLPAEIRFQIWDLVFTDSCFTRHKDTEELILDPDYSTSKQLRLRLVCRQIYNEIGTTAFEKTPFVLRLRHLAQPPIERDPREYFAEYYEEQNRRDRARDHDGFHLDIIDLSQKRAKYMECDAVLGVSERLSAVSDIQRSRITKLVLPVRSCNLDFSPLFNGPTLSVYFGLPALLEVTYYFDDFFLDFDLSLKNHPDRNIIYVAKLVMKLERWEHVKVIRYMRNGSQKKLQEWYRYVVAYILSFDYRYRYDERLGQPVDRTTWFDWRFDARDQTIEFVAKPLWPVVEESAYIELVKPLVKEITDGINDMDRTLRSRVLGKLNRILDSCNLPYLRRNMP